MLKVKISSILHLYLTFSHDVFVATAAETGSDNALTCVGSYVLDGWLHAVVHDSVPNMWLECDSGDIPSGI